MMAENSAKARTADVPNFDVERIRADFPLLSRQVHDKQIVYLDNAATSQKPLKAPSQWHT